MEPRPVDHRGVWTIKPPADMPITVVTMLQATINEAWNSYGGDPGNAEQFFNHLAGNGVADVPRETSPPALTVGPGKLLVPGYNERGERVHVVVMRAEAEESAASMHDPRDMRLVGGAYVQLKDVAATLAMDVPRETKEE